MTLSSTLSQLVAYNFQKKVTVRDGEAVVAYETPLNLWHSLPDETRFRSADKIVIDLNEFAIILKD